MCGKCEEITKANVLMAVNMLDNPILYLNALAIEKQMAFQLEALEDIGKFDGSLETAIAYLEKSGFKINKDSL